MLGQDPLAAVFKALVTPSAHVFDTQSHSAGISNMCLTLWNRRSVFRLREQNLLDIFRESKADFCLYWDLKHDVLSKSLLWESTTTSQPKTL